MKNIPFRRKDELKVKRTRINENIFITVDAYDFVTVIVKPIAKKREHFIIIPQPIRCEADRLAFKRLFFFELPEF